MHLFFDVAVACSNARRCLAFRRRLCARARTGAPRMRRAGSRSAPTAILAQAATRAIGCQRWRQEAKQRRRNAVKKRKEEKRGEKRAAKEQAKPKRPGGAVMFREGQQEDRKARDRKTVQKRAKGRGRGRREPLPPLQGLAQGLNPNRGG